MSADPNQPARPNDARSHARHGAHELEPPADDSPPSRVDRRKIVLPLLVLIAGLIATVLMVQARPDVQKAPVEVPPPLVRVVEVEPSDLRLDVSSQGTVVPRTEAQVVAEVAGRVSEVSPRFEAGGFVRQGETLLEIDRRDYELAITSARAQLAQAEVALAREEAEAAVARDEWGELGRGEADPLVLREPQLAEARARLAAAEAAVAKARLDLERTTVTAPFTGRVRATRVDLGEFVNRGTPLAVLYSVDAAEIRLPVADPELEFLDLPEAIAGSPRGPMVELVTEFAGRRETWKGRIVRTEGEIDPQTRMVYLVARVDDPYGLDGRATTPLAVGLFVRATIEGKTFEGVVRLPRETLRAESTVAVVDPDERVRLRRVEVLRAGADHVVVSAGLEPGERVLLSNLDTLVDGMRVRVADRQAPAPWLEGRPDTLPLDRADSATRDAAESAQTETATGGAQEPPP
ncbi:MAG TPA: efflux RND transporter periplasmic adaptor subunit [Thermoanaerobaculia bacterium]|nr:efflux RND transporter periplasmic adaptor subunit [Thermoanaerobaculia bacterium]